MFEDSEPGHGLRTFTGWLDETGRARAVEQRLARQAIDASSQLILRGGAPVDIRAQSALWQEWRRRRARWTAPVESDRWLAPRLHHVLRLTRAEASDRQMWHWLAVHECADYLEWRWGPAPREDRWVGPIHKQALARLWWTAELFRDGQDYGRVERAFVRQDFVNSFLHRPLVRCRSFALGLVDLIAGQTGGRELTASQINDLARVLNLCTASRPPEVAVGFQQDDYRSAARWLSEDVAPPSDWEPMPLGPPAFDTTESSLEQGRSLAVHGWEIAVANVADPM